MVFFTNPFPRLGLLILCRAASGTGGDSAFLIL
jgi:hypothetical protein